MFKKTALASAMLAAMTAQIASAQEQAAPAQDEQVEEVVVTGIRGSLSKALDIKRDSAQIVEAIAIKSLAPAEYSFDGDLTSLNEVASAGTVTGNRIDNTGGAVSYVEGVKGSAVNLDGMSGVRLPNNLISSSSYTISLWLKPATFTDYTTAFFGGANGTYWLSLVPSMAGTGMTRVWANGLSFYDNAEMSKRIPEDKWTHIVIMVDGENNNTIKLYENGVLQVEAPGFNRVMTVAGDTNEFALGVNYWDTPFNGAIDELKVFTGTISAEKINSLYQEGAAAAQ